MRLIGLLIKEAFISVWRHKFRSFLAFLGVTVGIVAVIVLVSVGNGVKKDVTGSIESIGTNLIVVLTGKINTSMTQGQGFDQSQMGNPANFISGDILKMEDVNNIKKIEGVKAAAPIALVSGNLMREDKFSFASTMGTTPDMENVFSGYKLKYGRFINDKDDQDKSRVIIAGDSVRKQLFGEDRDNMVGEKIKLGKEEFEIIGQLEKPKNAGTIMSTDFDSVAIIPFSVAKELNKDKENIMRIGVVADNPDDISATVERIKANMKARHGEDEFSVLTQDELLGMFNTIIDLLTNLITAIAAISLIVGGIGISSVMFISVADRTREIGIRKAIGATNSLIMFQFMVESIILSVLGGIFGLILSQVVNRYVESKLHIAPDVTPEVVILALVFCMGVGILFGLIPAARAAMKDPVEALREG